MPRLLFAASGGAPAVMTAADHPSSPPPSASGFRWRRLVLWLSGYVAVAAVATYWLWSARQNVIAELSSESAIQQWQQFNEDMAEQQRQGSPVTRKLSPSDEPPSLVLLRDYFGGILLSVLVIVGFLYAFVAFLVEGLLRSKS